MVNVGYIQRIFPHQGVAAHGAAAQVLTSRHDAAGAGVDAMGEAVANFNELGVGRVTVAAGLRVVALADGNLRRAVKWLLDTRADPLELSAVSLPRGMHVNDKLIDELAASSVVLVTNDDRDAATGADQFAQEFIQRGRAAADHAFEFLSQGQTPEPNEIARPQRKPRPR